MSGTKAFKKTICLDFDGVVHSFDSGWKGPRKIDDLIVPGAINFMADLICADFEVAILSARSGAIGGRRAMKKWLYDQVVTFLENERAMKTPAIHKLLTEEGAASYEPWYNVVRDTAQKLVYKQIKWPRHKPPAVVYIDDRAHLFTGKWPSIDELKDFRPWNKQIFGDSSHE